MYTSAWRSLKVLALNPLTDLYLYSPSVLWGVFLDVSMSVSFLSHSIPPVTSNTNVYQDRTDGGEQTNIGNYFHLLVCSCQYLSPLLKLDPSTSVQTVLLSSSHPSCQSGSQKSSQWQQPHEKFNSKTWNHKQEPDVLVKVLARMNACQTEILSTLAQYIREAVLLWTQCSNLTCCNSVKVRRYSEGMYWELLILIQCE